MYLVYHRWCGIRRRSSLILSHSSCPVCQMKQWIERIVNSTHHFQLPSSLSFIVSLFFFQDLCFGQDSKHLQHSRLSLHLTPCLNSRTGLTAHRASVLLLFKSSLERGATLVTALGFLEVSARVSSQFGLGAEDFPTQRARMLTNFDLSYYLLYLW